MNRQARESVAFKSCMLFIMTFVCTDFTRRESDLNVVQLSISVCHTSRSMDKSYQAKDQAKDKEILEELCVKHGVDISTVEELLKVEKQNRFRERRHGIYDSLRDCIQNSLLKDER